MDNMDLDEICTPCTDDDAIAANIERIKCFYSEGDAYASTSQMIMIGLALCRPDLLEIAGYPNTDIRSAWARLNDPQREAVVRWWVQ